MKHDASYKGINYLTVIDAYLSGVIFFPSIKMNLVNDPNI